MGVDLSRNDTSVRSRELRALLDWRSAASLAVSSFGFLEHVEVGAKTHRLERVRQIIAV